MIRPVLLGIVGILALSACQTLPPDSVQGWRGGEGDNYAQARSDPLPAAKDDALSARRLHGTWESEPMRTSLGPMWHRVIFQPDGALMIDTFSMLPVLGRIRRTSGHYVATGTEISSENLRDGARVRYEFVGQQLRIEYRPGEFLHLWRVR